jgi:hypothetical protein
MWPQLSAARDRPTIAALHLFSQVLGKVATAVLPWRNHGWHVALHVTPRGLRTEPIHAAEGTFELLLDLTAHEFVLEDRNGIHGIALDVMSVAEFHESVVRVLAEAGYAIPFDGMPNEITEALPFAEDREVRNYDPASGERVRDALVAADRVFRLFRSSFLGKVSPVHFFWGSFDLAVTRFSGRRAPLHGGGVPNLPDAVTREAYSHEVSSAGFWPGSAAEPGEPFFYSYAYPVPEGFGDAAIISEARFDSSLGEFVLPYAVLLESDDPDALLLSFLERTYDIAADLAHWDRGALECARGQPRIPRAVHAPDPA